MLTVICFGLIIPDKVFAKADDGSGSIQTSELPSDSYLRNKKSSFANSSQTVFSAKERSMRSINDSWSDDLPGQMGDWAAANNVGAPLSGNSLPIALSILLLYILYRKVTTSKRKNDL